MYKIDFKIFENTDKFRQAAIHFQQYGYYTSAPKGTSAFKEYWDQERNRCLHGFVAEDGERISGYNYFYLNYCQILLIKEVEVVNADGKKVLKLVKTRDFPRFYDFDKYFFDTVEECERLGKHLTVLKSRRKGYSFKVASMLCRNYFLIPNSKGFALASMSEYLIRDGILSKAWEIMDFIDENTAWAKKRQKTDSRLHKRASLVIDKGDGVKTEIGYKSEIIGVTLGGDYSAARGKSGKLIIFEEAGSFPHLKAAWQVARPSVEQGSTVHGLMIAFGTGGTEDVNFEGLKDLFYEPDAYNCLPIENMWEEEGSILKPAGFFVPYTANLDGEDEENTKFMDDQGNSLIDKCKKFVLLERQKIIENASDRTMIDRYVAEHCLTPSEATLNISTNIFPKEEMLRHLANIRNSTKLRELKQVGDLNFDGTGKVVWTPSSTPKDLTRYRLSPGESKKGQLVIWEHPIDNPPWGLYIAGVDPYDHDKSSTDSLLSIYIYKRFSTISDTGRIIVAEYTGRPEFAEEAYEEVRKMLLYYNATAMYENQCKGMFPYFASKHSEYLLADQPDIIRDIVKLSAVERRKGIHMSKEIKIWMEGKIREWLVEETSPGIKRLTTLMSEPLLEELIAYNDTGNFDRVIAFGLSLIYEEELFRIIVKKHKKEVNDKMIFKEPFFQKVLFKF
jgi:hypothetical protein